MWAYSVGSEKEWRAFAAEHAQEFQRQRAFERDLIATPQATLASPAVSTDRARAPFTIRGTCYVCNASTSFAVDYRWSYIVDGVETPNWREHLACPRCGLNNRMRAAVHLIASAIDRNDASILIAEQTTPLYRVLASRYPQLTGCEFLGGGMKPGERRADNIRNEDLTALSFESNSFNAVLTFDVFEHIPVITTAFDECWRVLKPGGVLFFSVPFLFERATNLVRAVVQADGTIRHLTEPEYHGDPLNAEGCLAFYHFGWEMLEQLKAAGFSSPSTMVYWSDSFGYLGKEQAFFTARKPL